MKLHFLLFSLPLVFIGFFLSCNSVTTNSSTDENVNETEDSGWLIPEDQVFEGAGREDIPSIDDPSFKPVGDIDFLEDDELIVGIKIGDEIRGYPHQILNYHEIVNDFIGDEAVAVTFCPLTGSALAWDREIEGEITEFGVSGLIHKNNLIAYDRATNSYWSQMLEQSVNGERIGARLQSYNILEMNWEAWKQHFPDSEVLTGETGFDRNYSSYPYGRNYSNDDDNIVFPIHREDDRLDRKELGHGVLYNLDLHVFVLSDFPDTTNVVNRNVAGEDLVIIGNSKQDFINSFSAVTSDGIKLRFSISDQDPPALMEDEEGNIWNYFGEAISGPRTGEKLKPIRSYNAYWFAWADFFGMDPRRPHISYP